MKKNDATNADTRVWCDLVSSFALSNGCALGLQMRSVTVSYIAKGGSAGVLTAAVARCGTVWFPRLGVARDSDRDIAQAG